MAATVTNTKTGKYSNVTLSGSSSLAVNAVDSLDQIVSAGTEEEAAMGLFKDHQLQSIALRCDQDATAQFLGVRYALTSSTAGIAGAPGILVYGGGDLEDVIRPGDLVRIEGTVANDGVYLVETVAFGATTVITFANGQELPGTEGALGTVARVCSHQVLTMEYAIATAAVTGVLTLAGDLSDKFAAGDFLKIIDSTDNDGYWEIDTVATDGPPVTVTTITVNGGALPDATNDGRIVLTRASFELPANDVFLWDQESGQLNPFFLIGNDPALFAVTNREYFAIRGDVDHCMVTVPGTTNGQFLGLVSKNPELP